MPKPRTAVCCVGTDLVYGHPGFDPWPSVDAAGNRHTDVWCRACGCIHQKPTHCPHGERGTPKCPHCGEPSVETLYASTFHEHTCKAGHVWRIY